MNSVNLIFPHQLFRDSPLLNEKGCFMLVEENLYFNHFKFHVQKLILHRSSMKFYNSLLLKKKKEVKYIDQSDELSDIRCLIPYLRKNGCENINYISTDDNYLERRLTNTSK